MIEPEEHHIVSKFYLRGFIDPNLRGKTHRFWVYRRGHAHPIPGSPKKTARLLHYNTIKLQNMGCDNATVETLLNIIETPASQIWGELHDRQRPLTDEERMTVAEFIALAAARVPSTRQTANQMVDEDIRAVMKWQATHFDELTEAERASYGISAREDLDSLITESKGVDFGLHQNAHIESMLYALPGIADVIYRMKWKFLHAPSDFVFVTSDNPVVRMNPNYPTDFQGQDGFGFPGVQVTFPIDAQLALLLTWEGAIGHVEIGEALVNVFNQITTKFASHEVYSPRKMAWLDEYFASQIRKPIDAA